MPRKFDKKKLPHEPEVYLIFYDLTGWTKRMFLLAIFRHVRQNILHVNYQ